MLPMIALQVAVFVLPLLAALPQAVRILRTRCTDGVSGTSATLLLAACAGWTVYAAGRERWVPFAADLVLLALAAAAVGLLAKHGGIGRRDVAAGAAAAAGLALVAAAGHLLGGGWVLLGTVLAGTVLLVGVPQLVTALKARSLAGLSITSLAVLVLNAGLWVVYGAVMGDGPYVLYGLLSAAVSGPVLVKLLLWHRAVARMTAPRKSAAVPETTGEPILR